MKIPARMSIVSMVLALVLVMGPAMIHVGDTPIFGTSVIGVDVANAGCGTSKAALAAAAAKAAFAAMAPGLPVPNGLLDSIVAAWLSLDLTQGPALGKMAVQLAVLQAVVAHVVAVMYGNMASK